MARTFEQYMALVNLHMRLKCGMQSDDLPDYDYASAYADGVAPNRVAARAISAAGEF